MDFADQIIQLAEKARQQAEHIQTEEATKNAFVMPFINALGYNVFNPQEVVPEYTADVGTKRGEKVDYAILKDGKLIILVECKSLGTDLNKAHASQLYRYFTVTDVRFGVLTNGTTYHFYADLDRPNVMDDKPFLVFDLHDYNDRILEELKKFTKSSFDQANIVTNAGDLKYGREIRAIMETQFSEPSEDFVRFFANQVYSGRLNQSVIDYFADITKQAMRSYINTQIERRLKTALEGGATTATDEVDTVDEQGAGDTSLTEAERDIETTRDEIEGYFVVKAILRSEVDVKRIAMRDTLSYFGILLDDNNRKPICRLHFNRSQKYLGLFNIDKSEERIPIETIDDIYQHSDRLRATIHFYDEPEV